MEAVIGTLLFAVAVTLFTWSATQYRLPVRARWTRGSTPAMFLALVVASALMFAFVILIQSLLSPMSRPVTPLDIAGVAAILIAGGGAMYGLVGRWRKLNRLLPVNDTSRPTGNSPSRRPGRQRTTHRKAA